MNRDKFKTPGGASSAASGTTGMRTTTKKRDTLAAELERDPQTSTAKRQQRAQVFTSNMAHASLERQLVAAQTAKVDLETKLREKDLLVERLERDRRWLAEREEKEREDKEKERVEHETARTNLENELRSTRTLLREARDQNVELQEEHSSLSRSTSHATNAQQAQLSTLTRQVALLQQELGEARAITDARTGELAALQDELDGLRTANERLMRDGAQAKDWAVLQQELTRLTSHTRTLDATNAKLTAEVRHLRERNTSVELLREQKRELERKLAGAEQARERIAQLEAQLEIAKSSATPQSTPQHSSSMSRELSNLRVAHARLLEEHGESLALLKQREAQLAEAERRENEILEVVEQMEPEMRALKDKVARREMRTAVAEREVQGLKALLASYAEEASAAGTEALQSQRVAQLETLLSELKAINDRLQSGADGNANALPSGIGHQRLSAALDAERDAKRAAENALEQCQNALANADERVEVLEQRLFELQGEIGGGRHVPPGVRVLSMRDNPAQQWADLRQAALDRLKNENETLLARLRELEEGGACAQNPLDADAVVPRASFEVLQAEKAALDAAVRQKEKRLRRLQEVFTAKSQEFKDAIGAILGLKLAFYPNGQVRVTSQYDLACSFVFQPARDGGGARMQLVAQGEGGPEDEIAQWTRTWIEGEQCIPGFLATVTLECYDRWKMAQERGDIEE